MQFKYENNEDPMTERSIPATGGVTDDPIRLGTMLYTLVEPHKGHQVAYNRWYERDHFYAAYQIGAYNFSAHVLGGGCDLRELPLPEGPAPISADTQAVSYLGVF